MIMFTVTEKKMLGHALEFTEVANYLWHDNRLNPKTVNHIFYQAQDRGIKA